MASPFSLLEKFSPTRQLMASQYLKRARQIVGRIAPYVMANEKVIDIGCGTGFVAKSLLGEKPLKITLVDVQPNPLCNFFPVTLYDGKKLPFADKSFDTALLIAVLHHCLRPMRVFEEALRVSRKKIIVMEDLFESNIEKWLTLIEDSIVNWEFRGHPHNNKSEKDWFKFFQKHRLKVLHFEKFRLVCAGFPFRLGIFVLEKRGGKA